MNPERVEKPWSVQRKAELKDEYYNLSLDRSYLQTQISKIEIRMTQIKLEIMEGFNYPIEDPGKLGYGRTNTALDIPPIYHFSPKELVNILKK